MVNDGDDFPAEQIPTQPEIATSTTPSHSALDGSDPNLGLTLDVLLHRITNRIRQSLELQEILSAAVAEVRSFLGTDRIKIYQFEPDGHGVVIAESLQEGRLPSLLGLHFPADDIPPYARELFVRARQRAIVDVSKHQIGISPLDCALTGRSLDVTDVRYRPVDPCHMEYLTAMGVKSSVVVPIVIESAEPHQTALPSLRSGDCLWGLLVSHHTDTRDVTERELTFIQAVVDQLSVAIAQSILLDRVRAQAKQEASINRITALLYTTPTVQLQDTLAAAVALFGGSGGRLYLVENQVKQPVEIYVCGTQPARLDLNSGRPIEENLLWQKYLHSTTAMAGSDSDTTDVKPWSVKWMRAVYALAAPPPESSTDLDIWAIPDIYREPLFRVLVPSFQTTPIRGVLILPLRYGRELLGCLSVFRDEVSQELTWAGYHDPDTRQLMPRQSFEIWRQVKTGQAQAWTEADLRLAQALGERFSVAVKQYRLYQQVQTLNANLAQEIQVRTAELQRSTIAANHQRTLAGILAKLQQSTDTTTIFGATTQEVRQLLKVDRVAIYRFDEDWGGEFIDSFGSVSANWADMPLATRAAWNDTYLQATRAERYRNRYVSAIDDIYSAELSPCHIEVLEHYHVRAYLIAPLFVGQRLWGLLAAYQHSGPHAWQDTEVTFVAQIATHLGIALQQSEFLRQATDAKDTADAANKAKSDFLANMSHELRTPLNAILGFVQLITRDATLNQEQKDYLEIIGRSGEHLLSLINDVLEMSKIEAGQLTLNETSFDLYRLLHSLEEMLELKAESKGLQLMFDRAPQVPQFIYADESKLRQVLINLLSNAIKFTEVGHVILRVNVGAQSSVAPTPALPAQLAATGEAIARSGMQLQFAVEDTGPGISPEDYDRLFEAFGQTHTGIKSQEGTGLGLPISRRFVRLMGGDITVVSTPADGTTFQFSIAIQSANATEVQTLEPDRRVAGLAPGQPEYRILVAEDKWANRQLLVKLLTHVGFAVREAANGQEAVTCWQDWQPHLIWMDMRMPVMDGYEATRIIKAQGGDRAPVILALTANAFEEDRLIALTIGCDDFVRKPFQEQLVLEKIAEHLSVRYTYTDPAPPLSTAVPRPPLQANLPAIPATEARSWRILVAEDNQLNQRLMLQMLKHLGYQADVVGDGLAVLERLRCQPYDIIFMDVQMPVMDGLTAARQIHQEWSPAMRPRIIAMTGHVLPEEQAECLASGMDACLAKPIRLEKLSEMLHQPLLVDATDAADRTTQNGQYAHPPELTPATLDAEILEELRLAGAEDAADFLSNTIDHYLQDAPKHLAAVKTAISQKQAPALHWSAHTLKGMSSHLGANTLANLCQELEDMSKQGVVTATAAFVDRLNTEYERVKLALAQERQKVQSSL